MKRLTFKERVYVMLADAVTTLARGLGWYFQNADDVFKVAALLTVFSLLFTGNSQLTVSLLWTTSLLFMVGILAGGLRK